MTKFETRFFDYLFEDTEEELAFKNSLDKGTDPGEFDVDAEADLSTDTPELQAAAAISDRNQAIKETVEGWITRVEEFLKFLNHSDDPNSIQYILANAEPDTILDRMKQTEQRKISRVATELAAMNESLRGYIAQTSDPKYKYI